MIELYIHHLLFGVGGDQYRGNAQAQAVEGKLLLMMIGRNRRRRRDVVVVAAVLVVEDDQQ